jgi:ABC-type phosphate/phosphonate transport system substrate-binding protein
MVWALLFPALLGLLSSSNGQTKKPNVLRIGTSGSLALDTSGAKDDTALETLKSFIKTETGFDNEIIPQKNWSALAEKLAGKEVELGVFQGYEFAWARAKYSSLQPLALAVNVYPYRFAYLVIRQDNTITDVRGLQGRAVALPNVGQAHLGIYLDHLTRSQGKTPEAFFSRVTTPTSIEDALDDVVDKVVDATVVDRVGLEAYKRRKPGRFSQLKALARSSAFPPPLVAYCNGALDQATLDRFQQGLLNASRKEAGQKLLTLFKLTGFATLPQDFDRVLQETQQQYPPPNNPTK